MTIIAHYKGVFYADRLHVQNQSEVNHRHLRSKLHVNEDKTIAFCYTGLEINPQGLQAVITALYTILELNNRIQGIATVNEFINDERISTVLDCQRRMYLVMTREQCLAIGKETMRFIDKDDLVVDGFDGNFFQALCLAGMDPKEIIPYIYDKLSRNISREFDTIRQTDLKKLRFIDTELEPGRAIKKFKSQAKKIANTL